MTENDAAPADHRTDASTDATSEPETGGRSTTDLETLVGDWLTVPDIAERLGVSLSAVRTMLADRELIASRIGPRRVLAVPARFLTDEGPRPELRGTITVLADGGYDDDEAITWLYTPDSTLPVEGAPIDAMWAGFKTEVRRRAQELAF
ncbi:excisionase family DNA binding protein [Terracoccus luteus]|uniref:Excisionase family DNA binding protein n=1 Tax=Terracoccus luteus TaxID=53356 RepID=A0A495XY86_9MICO|nr:excisionase family DNA binding protein [Terracoccus luteus]MCP2170580.1 excisionase family DNA binding protein [Terracoccus luteus]RKT77814.1 excisionase family DNA binding protein [Terracoccus luteus]